MKKNLKDKIIFTLKFAIVLLSLLAVGSFFIVYFGFYNIAALSPHYNFEIKAITILKRRSVIQRAQNIKVPDLTQKKFIKKGLKLYQAKCLFCHGAPDIASSSIIRGLNPVPPPLVSSADRWKNREIAWIIKNGFKMTGMPGFNLSHNSEDLYSLTAFVIRLNTLSPQTYKKMQEWTQGKIKDINVQWRAVNQGWDELKVRGNVSEGELALKNYGCLSCHRVDNVNVAQGDVGPPLNEWKAQHYIAGKIINNPINLVHWIRRPKDVEIHTSMPDLDVSEKDAWDIAAFLYQ